MKNLLKFTSTTGIVIAMLATTTIANAQKGGNSGGSETGVPFTIASAASVNGAVPTWSGTYNLVHASPGYYTFDTIQVSIKGKPLNLPDNYTLRVTYYFSDKVTGTQLPPVQAANLTCTKSVGTIKNSSIVMNPVFSNIYRHLDQVVVTADDGTIVLVAKG